MAVDDTSFINVINEEISRSSLVQEMIDFYQEKLKTGETKITDFNEGSEIRTLLEAFAVDLYTLMENENELTKIGFVSTAEGDFLDLHGENPLLQMPRNLGTEATGFVTFSVPSELTSELIITEGTLVVASETGLEYTLVNEVVIGVGETSAVGLVECLTTGTDGNVDIGGIDTIDTSYLDLDTVSVTNTEAFTDGVDYEEDDEYRERLLQYIQKDDFGSQNYYTTLAESVTDVHDVLLVDDSTYTKKAIVNGFSKPTQDSVLLDVLTVLSDSNNLVIGHSFTVDKPTYTTLNLDVTLTTNSEFTTEEITELLTAFFDGGSVPSFDGMDFDGLNIGQDVLKNDLYGAFQLIDDIQTILIKINNSTDEMTDVTIADTSVAKLDTVTLHQTIIE